MAKAWLQTIRRKQRRPVPFVARYAGGCLGRLPEAPRRAEAGRRAGVGG